METRVNCALAYRRCVFFLFLFFFPAFLHAEVLEDFSFKHLRVPDGLNNSIVYQVIQDGDGVLWFGLHDGIDKYNGYDFRHYDLSFSAELPAQRHHPVNAICQHSGESFWIAAGTRVLRYNVETDTFDPVVEDLALSQNVNLITALTVSPDSMVYMGTNVGLITFDLQTGKTLSYATQSASVLSLHLDNSLLWVGTGEGVKFFDTRRQSFTQPYRDQQLVEFFGSVDVLSFYRDTLERFMLIGTRNRGLYYFDPRVAALRELKDASASIPHVRVIRMYKNHYLVGTDGNGMVILDKSFQKIAHYDHDEDNPGSLSNDGVYDIHVDPQDRLWISTYGGGINIYDPNRKAFHTLQHEPNKRNSLRNNVIRSFLEYDDHMVFGTAKGISVLQPGGKWRHLPPLNAREDPKIVLSMCRDSRGRIWVGTFSGGVEVRDRSGRLLKTLRSQGGDGPELTTDYIYQVYKDGKGNMWMGGIRGGLMRYDRVTGTIESFPEIQNVHDIVETREGLIMAGTLSGVYFLEQERDTITVRTGPPLRIYAIHESGPGEYWLATEGTGLVYFNRSTGVTRTYTREDGLPSNIVYGILEDDYSDLWLSTTAGLSHFDPVGGHIHNYSITDGIVGKDFNYGAFYKGRNGTLYFGSSEGVTYFDPVEIRENTRIPELIFTDISIFGKDVDNPDNPLHGRNINRVESLELKHNQSSFTIDFAAINYTGTEKNQYRWKLSGGEMREGEWTAPSYDRRAVFSYLPPGNYTFQVMASNNDGYWNEAGRSLQIAISPPFWNTLVAKLMYVFMAILLFIALQRYIFAFINEKQAREKISFFINVAHDIRTPLTLIRAPMSKLMDSEKLTESEREELNMAVHNSERLNRLVNQLLDFQKASLNKHALKVSKHDLVALLHGVLNNFQPLMDERMINARLDCDLALPEVYFDRSKIEKILYNLVSNAIKYSQKGGEILISVRKGKKKNIEIRVRDNGRGIPAKQQKEIFKRYFRAQNAINSREPGSGVGLMLSKRLAEIHKGGLTFSSTEGKGSVFCLSFPADKSAYTEKEQLTGEVLDSMKEPPSTPNPEMTLSFSRRYTVLVVEDNPDLRRYLRRELSEHYNVLSAKNGKPAFEMVLKMNIDLIISDVMMPEMDGRTLCYKVRNNLASSHIPVILLTALNSVQHKIEGLEYGADDYIEKPFDIQLLKVRVANLLTSMERLRKRFLDQPDEHPGEEIANKPDQELMVKLHDLVKSRITQDDFTVKEMCRLAGMSRPVLYRKLKAYTGHSPQEYLIILRLNHASGLFRGGKQSIKEVAYESGFSDPKYFSKCFKKHYGVSPTTYISGDKDSHRVTG